VRRWTGLPGDSSDVGDWANPLGLAALAVETSLVPLAAARLCPGSPGRSRAAAPPRRALEPVVGPPR
jgi:hypothetical protein